MKNEIFLKQIYDYHNLTVFSAVILVLSFFTANIQAQKTDGEKSLRAGEALPKFALLAPGGKSRNEQFVSFLMRGGKGQNFSFLTRTLEIVRKEGGQEVLRVVQRYEDASGTTNVDTSEMLLKNLLPVSYAAELTTQAENFEFLPGRVKGIVTQKTGETENYDVPLEEPIYNAVVQTKLVQALPLAGNYVAKFRQYNPGKQFLTMTARVTGSEKVRIADDKIIDAWLVRLEGGYVPITYWIAKKTQERIKQKAELKNGGEFWSVRVY